MSPVFILTGRRAVVFPGNPLFNRPVPNDGNYWVLSRITSTIPSSGHAKPSTGKAFINRLPSSNITIATLGHPITMILFFGLVR